MKIEIDKDELKAIFSILKDNTEILNLCFSNYQKGEQAREEKIYKFLVDRNIISDCKHGRPPWSCEECFK